MLGNGIIARIVSFGTLNACIANGFCVPLIDLTHIFRKRGLLHVVKYKMGVKKHFIPPNLTFFAFCPFKVNIICLLKFRWYLKKKN